MAQSVSLYDSLTDGQIDDKINELELAAKNHPQRHVRDFLYYQITAPLSQLRKIKESRRAIKA